MTRNKVLPMMTLAVALGVAGPATLAQHAPDPSIQGAKRYHDTQITRADVRVVEHELAIWIQGDTFVKDPEVRTIAPLEAIHGTQIAPLEAIHGTQIAPLEAIHGTQIAPLEAAPSIR